MQSPLEDTFSQLPAVTRPVPSIPLRTLRSGAQRSSRMGSGVTNPELAALARDEGRRWSWWGAARDGARTVVSRRQRVVVASFLVVALATCVLAPRAFMLVPVAFVTF